MKGWLQKIIGPPARSARKPPVPARSGASLPAQPLKPLPPAPNASLPNATVIYGIGASLMFVAAFFLLIAGRWFPAIIVFSLGACLTGFALHLLKHQD